MDVHLCGGGGLSLLDKYSDSESSDTDDEGYSVFNLGAETKAFNHGVEINTENGTFLCGSRLGNIQIGSGRVVITGGANRNTSRDRAPAHKENLHGKSSSNHPSRPSKCLTDSQAPPSVADLNHICNNLGKEWKKLARALGHSKATIDTIRMDYETEGVYEMAWQAILKWRRKQITDVKICDIARLLEDIGMKELARELPVSLP